MATTRELVIYILENNNELRKWFEAEHGFTIQKAQIGSLEDYEDLVEVIINEGVNSEMISPAQARGTAALR